MTRSPVEPSVDSVVFHRTARRTKAINLYPRIMRGGIRL